MITNDHQLAVRDVCIDYATEFDFVRAVDHVSFAIKKGEVFGLAGESGCGKSTIAFAIARLTRPPGVVTHGDIFFDGENVLTFQGKRLQAYRWAQVSMVFQSAINALNPVMTIADQIHDTLRTHTKVSKSDAKQRAQELLELVGINKSRINDYPHQFSGGMRQRIGIGLALALNPKLIIMDEPTTALDVVVQREIMQEIYSLKEQFGFSILFITHDLSLMVEFSNKIGIMYAAELVEIAPAKKILAEPFHPYTVALGTCYPSLKGAKTRLIGIPGNPLDLNHVPPGCRFQDRCERVHERCRKDVPPLTEVGENHQVACHLYS